MVQTVLNLVIKFVAIPLIPVVATFLVRFIKAEIDKRVSTIKSEELQNVLNKIVDTIAQAVISTTQTYVDSLKKKGGFGEEEQKNAFNQTKSTVNKLLSEEDKAFLTREYKDPDLWLDTKIEQMVVNLKDQNPKPLTEGTIRLEDYSLTKRE